MAHKFIETDNVIYNLNAIARKLEDEAAELRRVAEVYNNHKGHALNDSNLTEQAGPHVRRLVLGALNNSGIVGNVESALRSASGE